MSANKKVGLAPLVGSPTSSKLAPVVAVAALMLIVNLLLLSVLSAAADGQAGWARIGAGEDFGALVKLTVAVGLALWLFTIVARRNGVLIALYAVPLMAVGAIAILPSLVFRYLALAGDDPDRP